MRHLKLSTEVLLVLLPTLPAVPAWAEDAPRTGPPPSYLRLLGEPVPAIYGPSADDKRFS